MNQVGLAKDYNRKAQLEWDKLPPSQRILSKSIAARVIDMAMLIREGVQS